MQSYSEKLTVSFGVGYLHPPAWTMNADSFFFLTIVNLFPTLNQQSNISIANTQELQL